MIRIFESFFQNTVNLEAVSYEAVEAILTYIYKGAVKLDKFKVPAFLQAVNKLGVDNLQNWCKLNLKGKGFVEFDNSARGDVFAAGFEKMFKKKKYFDVTIVAEGQSMLAHRNVLSVCSQYFQGIFSVVNPNEHVEGM